MSAPSISTVEGALRVLPGVECLDDGTVLVEQRAIAQLGARAMRDGRNTGRNTGGNTVDDTVGNVPGNMPDNMPGNMAVIAVDAGSRWFAEKVSLAGRCVALRLRPRPGYLCRAWRSRRGDSPEHEATLAADWHAPRLHRMPWGTVSVGIDPGLRGAAVLLFRANGAPEPLPTAATAFWRRRTPAEVRKLVAAALAEAHAWSATAKSLALPGHRELPVGESAAAFVDGWSSSLPPGFEWREGHGQWRARGTMGGWCFTLAFADRAGLLQLRWLMARLELEDTGAWDPVLERALHVAQRRWARKHLARDARWRAFNDVAARTGAELLVEWSAGEFAERTPEAPQPAAER